ncbi:hypothetical protein FNJ84_14640 [Paracoccus sp. M683]|uniref:hypothetical protein n=1 Tax=Paracoccus sp. M683 TaxID=2594268 RepID=UPI00117E6419|nr:hypothetical protein [Paracoccus sp. M683]TRW95632.1 hypothetical protein FNJ84_14640 [Paracoccus sp. M683]
MIDKTRHHIFVGGREWVVDEYHGLLEGVVLAEIELPSEDTHFELPAWVAAEVTGAEKYRKVNLVKARKKKQADRMRRARQRETKMQHLAEQSADDQGCPRLDRQKNGPLPLSEHHGI